MKKKDRRRTKRIIAIVLFVIQALGLLGAELNGGLDNLFSYSLAFLLGVFWPFILAIALLVSAHKEDMSIIEASKKNESTLQTMLSTQQTVTTPNVMRTTSTAGEITLEELQRERAEIEQRLGELKKVKDLLTPDAYYEAVDALSKEYDEVIAKIKLKL